MWIEIGFCASVVYPDGKSLPSRECGLKFRSTALIVAVLRVTPFAGVWIEIRMFRHWKLLFVSLPSRECGLKYPGSDLLHHSQRSLPSRECGLKSQPLRFLRTASGSLPSRECGLKFISHSTISSCKSHSLRGSVD